MLQACRKEDRIENLVSIKEHDDELDTLLQR